MPAFAYQIFHVIHLVCLFLLTGYTFQALANPDPAQRRSMMMRTGILSLLILIAGFGMAGIMKIGFPGWLIVKLVCWLLLSALAGIAYRKPEARAQLTIALIVIISVAVIMVSMKPF